MKHSASLNEHTQTSLQMKQYHIIALMASSQYAT